MMTRGKTKLGNSQKVIQNYVKFSIRKKWSESMWINKQFSD